MGFTTEVRAPSGTNLLILCPSQNTMGTNISWLDDTLPAANARDNSLRFTFISPDFQGIYQCLGEINPPDQPETDLTGELGNNVYVLVQCKH